jgi:hypothetical protein
VIRGVDARPHAAAGTIVEGGSHAVPVAQVGGLPRGRGDDAEGRVRRSAGMGERAGRRRRALAPLAGAQRGRAGGVVDGEAVGGEGAGRRIARAVAIALLDPRQEVVLLPAAAVVADRVADLALAPGDRRQGDVGGQRQLGAGLPAGATRGELGVGRGRGRRLAAQGHGREIDHGSRRQGHAVAGIEQAHRDDALRGAGDQIDVVVVAGDLDPSVAGRGRRILTAGGGEQGEGGEARGAAHIAS